MRKELSFLIYCIEEYRSNKNLTGKEVIELFEEYDVCQYILEYYEALHTTGGKYIVNDIDLYINAQK